MLMKENSSREMGNPLGNYRKLMLFCTQEPFQQVRWERMLDLSSYLDGIIGTQINIRFRFGNRKESGQSKTAAREKIKKH